MKCADSAYNSPSNSSTTLISSAWWFARTEKVRLITRFRGSIPPSRWVVCSGSCKTWKGYNDLTKIKLTSLIIPVQSYRKVLACSINQFVIVNRSRSYLHFSLFGSPISKVEIVGVVVAINIRESRQTTFIDDGTGVLRCLKVFFADEDISCCESFCIGKIEKIEPKWQSAFNQNRFPWNVQFWNTQETQFACEVFWLHARATQTLTVQLYQWNDMT